MSSLSSSSSSSSLDSLDSFDASSYFSSLARRRQQKKMSITQTYYLAHTARRKLTREASRADHDLRLLVGHANLLDTLMLDLADAEQEQERWFNQTVKGVSKSSPSPSSPSSPLADTRHIQWADTVVEDPEDDWDPEDLSDADSDLSDDSDFDEDDFAEERFAITTPIRRPTQSPVPLVTEREVPSDYDDGYSDSDSEFEYDDAEDLEHLILTRSPSRQSPPPDLSSDSDEESEDDTMPPSPPQRTLDTFADDEKQPQSTTIPLDADQAGLFDPRYYAASQSQGAIIEAY